MTEETLGAIQAENGYLILDIGCGRGMDAVSLGKKGGILFGVEPSRIMLRKAMEGITKAGEKVLLVRGLAEKLPFRNERFHRVFCKGALDHFIDPEEAVCEMRRVVLPAGKVVISIANFESLSCFLAKRMNHFFRSFMRREIPRPHIWEIPADHTFKFAYASILSLTRRHLQVEFIRGVSLFWGFPFWAKVLKILPPPCSLIILRFMDKIAAGKPNWGDVLVLRGKPRPHRVRSERP